jgi:DNA-binding LytR/AlgR family response regulator
MNCLIVDDNVIARTTLKELVKHVSDLSVAGECDSAVDAYNYLLNQRVDILLLDIEMPGMSGIDLTRQIVKNKPVIIFTTSKTDYAIEAFELNVADYIVKPITPPRFIQSIDRARELLATKEEVITVNHDEFIFIRDSNIVRRLSLDDLLFAEAMGDYVKLYTPQKFFAIHTTLKALEERLSPQDFVRVHRSFIVAVNKIDLIQDGYLIINSKSIPVADSYRNALNKRLQIL